MSTAAAVRDVLDAGLTAHVDAVMAPVGFTRRGKAATYRRGLPDLTQSMTFAASRRAGRPLWHVGARFEVEAPAVNEQALALGSDLPEFRRDGIATRPTFFFQIGNVWGIASGAWYVRPEGVPDFMAKVARHLSTKILPLVPAFSSIETLAADGVPEVVGRDYFDPLMIASCRLLTGDRPGAYAALAAGYDRSAPGTEWVQAALDQCG